MKITLPAGVFLITVCPTDTAQICISSGLSKMPLFDKYSKELMWGIMFAFDDFAGDLNKADIGEAPPEFLFKEIQLMKKSTRRGGRPRNHKM